VLDAIFTISMLFYKFLSIIAFKLHKTRVFKTISILAYLM